LLRCSSINEQLEWYSADLYPTCNWFLLKEIEMLRSPFQSGKVDHHGVPLGFVRFIWCVKSERLAKLLFLGFYYHL
jgi:hypothetical protein